MDLATKSATVNEKGIKLHILDLWVFHIPITWPKKTKAKIFVYIICLVRAQFWKCVRFSDFLVTLGLRSQISDDSNGEISLDDKRFRFESKSLEQGQTFCRRKNSEMYFYFLRNYSINYFRCFLWCGPKADKEKQRCRRTQSRDRGCHQKSIFSLRFPVRAAFCGLFFLIFALTFVKLCWYCCSLSIYPVYFVVF